MLLWLAHQKEVRMTRSKTIIALDEAELAKVAGGAFQQGTFGSDSLYGGTSADVIFAGGGNDGVASGAGNDQVYGEAGNDHVNTGSGNDIAYGGTGNDALNGGSGADVLHGEAGDDVLDGGAGDGAADLADGGAGNDTFLWAPGDGNDEFRGGDGVDTLNLLGMNLQDLTAALRLDTQGLQMQVTNNVVTFLDATGNPATFGGTVSIGGETLRFSEVERIRLG